MMAVRIEMGISWAEALRATVSTTIRKAAPKLMEAGKRDRWLLPNFIRHIWGTSKPTQPTWPHMETQEAVTMVAQMTAMPRSMEIFTPEERASSSLRGSRFRRQRSRYRMAMPARMGGAVLLHLR